MQSDNTIEHEGIVASISGDLMKVQMQRSSACGACHAKGVCGTGDDQEMTVHVKSGESYHPGEHVKVIIRQGLAMKAVFLSYVMPLIIVIVSLFVLSYFAPEGIAGLLSILALVPYFLFLKFSNQKLEKNFAVKIEKIGEIQI